LKDGIADGVIIVALLFTTPCALLDGDATVVFARVLTGQRNKAIAQR